MKPLTFAFASSLVFCVFLFSCSYTYDEEATQNIAGTYRFSYANTYTQYNNAQNAVVTDWSAENDYSVVIDKEGYLRMYKGDQILHQGIIDEIEDNGISQTVYYREKEISYTFHIDAERLTSNDFPFDCISGGGSNYGNFFFKEFSDYCIDCAQSDVLTGTYIGEMIVTNYYDEIIEMYPDTIHVSSENSTMNCKIRLVGIFDGVYHVNSLMQLVENIPGEGVSFKGDTVCYGKYYYGTNNNWRYSFLGVKQ